MSVEIKNARIESTFLGIEDHGIMTFMLTLDYGDSGQGAGGIALDNKPTNREGERRGAAFGLDLLMNILRVVGVDKWEALPGKHIRVKADWNKVAAIGNVLKDEWLDFDEFVKTWREREQP